MFILSVLHLFLVAVETCDPFLFILSLPFNFLIGIFRVVLILFYYTVYFLIVCLVLKNAWYFKQNLEKLT
ncbi:hypothetical protein BX070DRAFT_157018 [Coemansia spiralis]|nr:hypothetical protein BX070DRAFT_157018 [Coemansia spiralis]